MAADLNAEIDALVPRLMRPTRKDRRAVGAIHRACEEALAGTVSPTVLQRWWMGTRSPTEPETLAVAVAWEALAVRDIIPMPWIDASARRFLRVLREGFCELCMRADCAHVGVTESSPTPWSLCECVVFASDSHGVVAAESLAEEIFVARGRRGVPRVGWWTREADAVVLLRQDLEARLRAGAVIGPEWSLLATGYAVARVTDDAVELVAARV